MTGPPYPPRSNGDEPNRNDGRLRRTNKPRFPMKSQTAAVHAEWRRPRFEGTRDDVRRFLPGIWVSLAVHLAFLVALGFTVLRSDNRPKPTVVDAWLGPEHLGDPESTGDVEVKVPTLEEELRAAARQASAHIATAQPQSSDQPSRVTPVDVTGALAARSTGGGGIGDNVGAGGNRGAAAGSGSSTGPRDPRREGVDRALAWIARQQHADGHWSMTGPYPDGAQSREAETDTGATALALLALLGDGHSPHAGRHQKNVQQGINWLVDHQKPSGDLFDSEEQGRSAHFYAHSQATMALCEALALTGDESLRPAATKAVAFLTDAQNPRLGGWKYRPLQADGVGDLSVTGWALMALHTARIARIDVPGETFELASTFLDSTQADPTDPSLYRYRPDEPVQNEQLWSMSAEGLLCRQWLGWPRTHEAFARGEIYLQSAVNQPVWKEGERNVYAWYYTAQALHNLGGESWTTWFAETERLLLKHQTSGGGKVGGSWNPNNPKGAFLEWSEGAGRLYFSVMCVLILETPTRHQPIYREP